MPRVRIALGVAPCNAGSYDDEIEQLIRATAGDKRVKAIGSCGFDGAPDEAQTKAFARQVRLAHELDMPLIVEAHGAYGQALALLEDEGLPAAGVLVRAFDGSADELTDWVERGCYVSFDIRSVDDRVGAVEYAALVPQDRIMVESGAPYTTANLEGYPARADQVVFVADTLQSLCPPGQLASNFQALFGK